MIIKDGSDYLNLTQFAQYLTDQGLRYDRQKVNLYYERGKIPQPDFYGLVVRNIRLGILLLVI